MKHQITSGDGTAINQIKPGATNVLHGNPDIKTEKPHTIVQFPGGDVEIARTSDNEYWVHIAVDTGQIVNARLDADGRYCDETNQTMKNEIEAGDVKHIAFLVRP